MSIYDTRRGGNKFQLFFIRLLFIGHAVFPEEFLHLAVNAVQFLAVVGLGIFADEIQKKNPGMGRVKAEQLAWEQHPDLVAEYEAQA